MCIFLLLMNIVCSLNIFFLALLTKHYNFIHIMCTFLPCIQTLSSSREYRKWIWIDEKKAICSVFFCAFYYVYYIHIFILLLFFRSTDTTHNSRMREKVGLYVDLIWFYFIWLHVIWKWMCCRVTWIDAYPGNHSWNSRRWHPWNILLFYLQSQKR